MNHLEKIEFHNTCNSQNCAVTEYCYTDYNIPTTNYTSKISNHDSSNDVVIGNLYMNEVCKSIDNYNVCTLRTPECIWSGTSTAGSCHLNIETFTKPPYIKVPMAIPKNIGSSNSYSNQNNFATPPVQFNNFYRCSESIEGSSMGQTQSYDDVQFWSVNPPPIYSNQQCPPNNTQINNSYTNLPVNVYSSSTDETESCKYYGCVDNDKYITASIPDNISPLCQEILNSQNYYNFYWVNKPTQLSDIVNEPTSYGCIFHEGCLCPNGMEYPEIIIQ